MEIRPNRRRVSRLGWEILAWGFLGLVLVIVAVVAPIWFVSAADVPDVVKRLEVQNSIRGSLLGASAGTLFLVTAALGYRQFRLSQRQAEIAGTDLDSRIVAQLSSETPEIKVAAILEMGSAVARDSRDKERVADIIEVFIRRSSPRRSLTTIPETAIPPLGVRSPAVQEALFLFSRLRPILEWSEVSDQIGNEIRVEVAERPTFQLVDLRGADLKHGSYQLCDFQSSFLSQANLSRANLWGTQFDGVDLTQAILAFTRLGQCSLIDAKLDRAFAMNANFTMTVMAGASLKQADLRGTIFSGAYLEALSIRADWEDPELVQGDPASIEYARRQVKQTVSLMAHHGFLFHEVLAAGPEYGPCDLSGADIRGADFSQAAIVGALFVGARANGETRWPPGFDLNSAGVVFE